MPLTIQIRDSRSASFPHRHLSALTLCSLLAGLLMPTMADEPPKYLNPKAPSEERVEDLFTRLTAEEKLGLLSGTGFTTQPIPRLGVPPMVMVDAGQGVRGGPKGTMGPATAFPAGVALASSWDTNLVHRVGAAIAVETRNKGTGAQILLGPAVNIQRSPLGGRNGEYLSEDPFLAGTLGVAYIQGLQSTGVAACVKHFACNNQEIDRMFVDARVGERALREIYLPAFEAAVKSGGVWTLMTAYNKVNGAHASANPYLIQDVLKQGWQFDGLVISDWGGVHQTEVVEFGNDLEMPGGRFATVTNLQEALQKGRISQAAVDDSARRILRAIVRVGLLDGPVVRDEKLVNSPAHQQLALEAATKGIVLLKNDRKLLPLNRKSIRSIAVIGDPARDAVIGAGGSPYVEPLHKIQLLDALKAVVGEETKITFECAPPAQPIPAECLVAPDGRQKGFKAEYFNGAHFEGAASTNFESAPGFDAFTSQKTSPQSVRWTTRLKAAQPGVYTVIFSSNTRFKVLLNGKAFGENWTVGQTITAAYPLEMETNKFYELKIECAPAASDNSIDLSWEAPSPEPYVRAVAAAKQADVAIVCVSTFRNGEREGSDRVSMDLPKDQDALIRSVAGANRKTIVVLNNGTPVTMTKWIKQVPAVLETWYPGQEGGTALADILFGNTNPSGKLPTTLAANRSDYPDYGNFPGQGDYRNKQSTVNYAEGIFVGYRHFDKRDIKPLFPFGHGLSYTRFAYSNLRLTKKSIAANETLRVSVTVENKGGRAGDEIAQLYIRDTALNIEKPVRELKGFARVSLKPGEKQTVEFLLTPRDLTYFDVPGKAWRADAGEYSIEVGASSRDIRQRALLSLAKTFTETVPLSKSFPAQSLKDPPGSAPEAR